MQSILCFTRKDHSRSYKNNNKMKLRIRSKKGELIEIKNHNLVNCKMGRGKIDKFALVCTKFAQN